MDSNSTIAVVKDGSRYQQQVAAMFTQLDTSTKQDIVHKLNGIIMAKSKLTPQQCKDWVTALRSGQYQQGTRILKNEGKHCSLGVLCDVHPDIEWRIVEIGRYKTEAHNTITHYAFVTSAPIQIAPTPADSFAMQTKLAELNDELGHSFDQIADWIEANILPELERN